MNILRDNDSREDVREVYSSMKICIDLIFVASWSMDGFN
jgi:hypothetical protein